ncbi:MAG: HAD-IA family hydrolase [Pseudomonadota bacterium]
MLDDKRTLLLDMDGTLLDLAFDNHFWTEQVPAALAAARGEHLNDVKQELVAAIRASEGTLAWYCLEHWSRELNFDLVAFKETVANRIRFLDGARDFLARARAAGFNLVLVTNAHPETLRIKDQQTNVTQLVDDVVCSHRVGLPKEDERFWPGLLDRVGEAPERLLMVDDSAPVLATASRFVPVTAIAKPDSRRPTRDMSPYPSVERIVDLLAE